MRARVLSGVCLFSVDLKTGAEIEEEGLDDCKGDSLDEFECARETEKDYDFFHLFMLFYAFKMSCLCFVFKCLSLCWFLQYDGMCSV